MAENLYLEIKNLQYNEIYKLYKKLSELLHTDDANYKHEWYEINKNNKWYCDVCNKDVNYFAKSTHLKGKYHKLLEQANKKNEIVYELVNDVNNDVNNEVQANACNEIVNEELTFKKRKYNKKKHNGNGGASSPASISSSSSN